LEHRRRVLILGDDFTPAELFASAIRAHPRFPRDLAELMLVDLGDAEYRRGPEEGIREYLGTPAFVSSVVSEANVLVTTFAPVTESVLAAAASLELIVCGRGGPVNVDVAAATARGIPVVFAPGRNAEAVAEFVLGALVAMPRRFSAAEWYVRKGEWTDDREDTFAKPTGPELAGRTLGIVGFGAIGSRVAELVAPMRMHVLAFDPYVSDRVLASANVERADLDSLLAGADIVTVHARPSKHQRPILGERELAQMRPGSYLINTSRGVNVDESALAAALERGHLAGVALDVYANEPIGPDHPLLASPNVMVTPHAAGVSTDVPAHTAKAVADAVARWLTGEMPANVANAEALTASACSSGEARGARRSRRLDQ
jgi:D-3-phosphoglycerate dehydrogenase